MKASLSVFYITASVMALLHSAAAAPPASEPPQYHSRTKIGQPMPAFSVTDTSGQKFSIADLKGKVLLINFWATWCGPCTFEIPRLEKEVWQKYKADNFAMVAIAREQSAKEITGFRTKQGFTYPIAADPHRAIYKLFADAGIPRSYVVGRDGRILFESMGYDPAEFDRMKKVLEQELAATK